MGWVLQQKSAAQNSLGKNVAGILFVCEKCDVLIRPVKGTLDIFYETQFMEDLINNFQTLFSIYTYFMPSGGRKILGLKQPPGTAVEVMTKLISRKGTSLSTQLALPAARVIYN